MSFRPTWRTTRRSALALGAALSAEGVEAVVKGGGDEAPAGRGDCRGPWVLSCLYTAQKLKKKKSWKDGYCVCGQMTGFLRLTLFSAENCEDATLLLKTPRATEPVDTTELPLRPVERLFEKEIELPLHLVQVQGYAFEHEEARVAGQQKPVPEEAAALQGEATARMRPHHQQLQRPSAEHRQCLLQTCRGSPCPPTCAEALPRASQENGLPLGASTCLTATPDSYASLTRARVLPRICNNDGAPCFSSACNGTPSICAQLPEQLSRGEAIEDRLSLRRHQHQGAPPVSAAYDRTSPIFGHVPKRDSHEEVTEHRISTRGPQHHQEEPLVEETPRVQSASGVSHAAALHLVGDMHAAAPSDPHSLDDEVLSITTDAESRRLAGNQLMLRTRRSLLERQPAAIRAPAPVKQCPGAGVTVMLHGCHVGAPLLAEPSGLREQRMFRGVFSPPTTPL